MKVLRIKLIQNQASYTREETVNNRMTYPLPQYSTIIGALHNACNYTSYHPMEISVQGRYGSMQKEFYTNHALLNNLQDDRSVLIWLKNPNALHGGYLRVAEALKDTGNSFRKKITIRVCDKQKLEEYIDLKDKEDRLNKFKKEYIKPKAEDWKKEKKELKEKLKDFLSKSPEAIEIKEKIQKGDNKISILKEGIKRKENQISNQLGHFRTLTKGPQTQEVLYDIELVVHIRAEEQVIEDILKNQNNFVSLGRSEDFIDLQEIKVVELTNEIPGEYQLSNGYAMYVNADKVDIAQVGEKDYFLISNGSKKEAQGTIYYVAKEYKIIEKKRVFKKIPCLYSSYIGIDEESENALFDIDGGYIVDLN